MYLMKQSFHAKPSYIDEQKTLVKQHMFPLVHDYARKNVLVSRTGAFTSQIETMLTYGILFVHVPDEELTDAGASLVLMK